MTPAMGREQEQENMMEIQEAIETAVKIESGARDTRVEVRDIGVRYHDGGFVLDGQSQTGGFDALRLSDHAERQVAGFCGIPFPYWRKCRDNDPLMITDHVNYWFDKSPDAIRTIREVTPVTDAARDSFGDTPYCRAFLSGRFQPTPNDEVLRSVERAWRYFEDLPAWRIRVDENGLNFSAESPALELLVDDTKSRGNVGDIVKGGVRVRNSEIGDGSLTAALCLYRLICLNGMTIPTETGGWRRRHVGSEKTIQSTYLKFEESLSDILRGDGFAEAGSLIQRSAGLDLVEDWQDRLQKRFGFSEEEIGCIGTSLILDGADTLWGLANAVTAQAHSTASIDRKTELEAFGGDLITSPRGLVKKWGY